MKSPETVSSSTDVNRTCHVCGASLPPALREEFCPVCTLQGALAMDSHLQDASAFLGRIGDYELIEEIARGGVGVVYKARQLSLGRIVALKLLIAGQFADPKARARFRTEAEATASFRHPNIVTVYEVGEHDGLPFLAMEYVDGGTLAQCIGGEPLPVTAAGRYALKIARAIQFAHARGTLHRDLKPSNILLDAFDEPRVTDFGLAKQLGTDSELTLTGQVLGSPSFMAPEQAVGDQKRIGPATDVYALGAMLYQMIVGRPPFQAGSASEVLKQVEHDEPLRPSRLNPSVPQDLETIALKCLEKLPANRYASAEELAADLQRFIEHKPVAARPVGPLGKAWRWSRRNPALALSLVLLVTLAIGSTVAAWRIRVAERLAQENLRLGRLRSYAGDLALGDRASEEGDIALVRELLLRHVPKAGEQDLREFAWRWLWSLMNDQSIGSLTGHTHTVSQAIFFPDGIRLASGSWDGTVRIWNVPAGRVEHVLTNYTGRIWGIALSSDGSRLAACGEGGVRVWNTHSWQETLFIDRNFRYGSVAFCNRDRFLAIASRTSVAIYGVQTGRRYGPLSNSTPAIASSGDGTLLLTRKDDRLRVWDPARRSLVQETPTPGFYSFGLRDIEFSPDGDLIALGSSGGDVALLPWRSPTNLIRLERRMRQGNRGHMGWVSDVAFSPDGKMLATVSADHELLVWNTTNYQSRRFRGHLHEVWSVAFSPDGRTIATAGKDESIKLWSAEEQPPQLIFRLSGLLGVWSNSELLSEAAGVADKKSRRFVITDWKTRNVTREIVLPGRSNASCSFVQSRRGLAALGFTNGTVEVWNLRADSPTLLNSWKASAHAIRSGLFSIDDDAVAIRDASGASSVWEWRSGTLRTELGETPLLELNRRFAITMPATETPRVHDARTGAVLADLKGHKDTVPQVAFLSDGQRLATVSWDGELRLWELPAGRELTAFRFQRQGIYSVSISPDGRTLAASGQDGITRFWDVRTQQETARATGMQAVSKLWFSPDGNTLILGMPGEVRVIYAPTIQEIEQSETFRAAMAGFR